VTALDLPLTFSRDDAGIREVVHDVRNAADVSAMTFRRVARALRLDDGLGGAARRLTFVSLGEGATSRRGQQHQGQKCQRESHRPLPRTKVRHPI
jgi:hypothetical protein